MKKIVSELSENPFWTIRSPMGLPSVSIDEQSPRVAIPKDVLDFYAICGGIESHIQKDEDLLLSIVPPQGFEWALKKCFLLL